VDNLHVVSQTPFTLREVPALQTQKPEVLNYIPYGQEH